MSSLFSRLTGLVIVGGLISAAAYVAFSPATAPQQTGRRAALKGKAAARGPVPVVVEAAVASDIPVYLEGLGTVRALNTVTVQPLVDGRLTGVGFKEGQSVRKGDVLARIDPTIYKAQLDQAMAKLAQDEAQLADARNELERVSNVGRIASLKKSVDTAKSRVAQLEALVKADQAAVDLAETQLGYTQIKAPIDGRTGLRMVDEGNVVRASANSAIVVITQVQPISVLFNLPQQHLGRLNQAQGQGNLAVDALGPDGTSVIDSGVLQVIDNQVDQTTGTVRLKAEFPNTQLQLWPGQFVNVRLLIDKLRQVVVVPTAAIQQGPGGTFVYVVAADNTAAVRPVRIGQRDERQAVVTSGLQVTERVVTTGFTRLRDGAQVAISAPGAAPLTQGAGQPGPRKGKGKGGGRKQREGSNSAGQNQSDAGREASPAAEGATDVSERKGRRRRSDSAAEAPAGGAIQ